MPRTCLTRSALALVLGCALGLPAAAPATARPRDDDRPRSPLAALWEAFDSLWARLAGEAGRPVGRGGPLPRPSAEEGYPERDPNGVTTPPEGSDGHPERDPNGLAWPPLSDGHPERDPDGATEPPAESDGGPERDPNG